MPTQRVILAEYFTTDDLTLLFIAREDFSEPEVIQLKTPLAEMRQYVSKTFGTAASVRNLDESALAEWHARFSPMVEPILEWAAEDDIIWFVPHDVLHHVPLHAVKVEGRNLIERNPVCYSPSASVMKYCHAKRKGRRRSALVIGDPRHDLTHAREEAQTVADLFAVEPLIGESATKSRVLSLLEQQRDELDILHFACHGKLDREQALNSGILLAKEQPGEVEEGGDSGLLTATEIFKLQLNADLVTLSACDSGVSERRPGDELIGLTRALIYAGTPSVLVSLWSVDDLSTRLLMERFYLELLKEPADDGTPPMTKAAALQSAQKFVMNLTASQLVEYQESRSPMVAENQEPAATTRHELDRAVAYRLAGDVGKALSSCQSALRHMTGQTGLQAQRLVERAQRELSGLEDMHLHKAAADPDAKAFDDLFHWAPFVLIGDWK